MDTLKELINIISKRKLSQIEIFDKSLVSRKDTLFAKLYHAIFEGKINSDKEAIQYLYNDSSSEVKYRKLKSRFKTRLLNTLYFIDINNSINFNVSNKEYFDCLNKLYLSNILQRYADNRNASINLILENYSIAKRNNFFDILKEFSFKLLVHYGLNGKSKEYNNESTRYKEYIVEFENEQKAQLIFSYVLLIVNNKAESSKFKKSEINSKIIELKDLTKNSKSLLVYFLFIRSQLFLNELIGNNEEIDMLTFAYLSNHTKYLKTYYSETYLNTIYIYRLKSFFDLRKFVEVHALADEISKQAKALSFLTIKEFELKALLNSDKIEQSHSFVQQITHSIIYKNVPKYIKERWVLLNAYVQFIYSYKTNHLYKFSTTKLYNQLPSLIQDKSGLNLSVRIIEIVYLIAKDDLDNASQKIDTLFSYQRRYLKEDIFYRSNLFIKLLHLLNKKSFNYKQVKNATEFTILRDAYSYHIINESEIIFYDTLWEIILNVLMYNDNKFINNQI